MLNIPITNLPSKRMEKGPLSNKHLLVLLKNPQIIKIFKFSRKKNLCQEARLVEGLSENLNVQGIQLL